MRDLAWGPLPRSAPDTAMLDGVVFSGLPLVLRLFIDAHGRVADVHPVTLVAQDRAAFDRLRAMFMATAYTPGRRYGKEVASYIDLVMTPQPDARADAAPPAAD